jgi:acetyl-CoA acetyltransferase family protein
MAHTVTGPFTSTGREVYIAEAVRTPTGKSHQERGWYRDIHPNAMLAACYTELVARSGIEPALVEDLVIGCTAPFGEQSRNIARNAWLQAGYPPEVPATTLDRRCGSAQTAVEMGAALVASGTHDVVIAGGVEHMGHVPIDSPGKVAELYGDPWPAELRDRYAFVHQGESAELIADRWQLGREEMDAFAAQSHQNAAKAIADGRFVAEMVPMTLDGQPRQADQCVRPETTIETLANLNHCRLLVADQRWRGGGAAVLGRSRTPPRSSRACTHCRPDHRRCGPDHDADRAHSGDLEAVAAQQPQHRRHRPLRGE